MDKKSGTLEIEEDLSHHRLFWKIKRIGWVTMIIIVILSLFGLTGGGPSSERTAENENLKVEYMRFARMKSEEKLSVTVKNAADSSISVTINRDYIDNIMIEKITPEPDAEFVGEKEVKYTFNSLPGDGDKKIVFYHRPETFGNSELNIDVKGSQITLTQFIYP